MKCLKHKGLIILGCLLIIVLAITAYRYVNSYRIIELADSDAEVYTVYAAVCPEGTSVKELILTQGEIISQEVIGTKETISYSFDGTDLLLPHSKELREIALLGEQLYISYIADDGKEVILAYNDEGLLDLCVYDNADDTFVFIGRGKQEKHLNFRHGKEF